MVWTVETSCGFESDKIAAAAVHYLQGKRVLDIGCGHQKVWPSLIGIDNGHHFGKAGADIQGDGRDLSLFADNTIDAIFSSHMLEHVHKEQVVDVLREWARVLKVGGNIVLYIPSGNLYPRIGEFGANPDHKWDPMPGDIESMFSDGSVGGCWTMLECEERSASNEYSLFYVFRKEQPFPYDKELVSPFLRDQRWQRNPNGKKRALVIRYGAIGDILQTASVFPQLKKQGYHVTVNCKPSSQEIIRHDPNVDEWIIQDTDFVPNAELGPYWTKLAERYDLVINHCESIEGQLLAIPGRLNHMFPAGVRRKLCGTVNYVERLHDLSGTECVPLVKFYPTVSEVKWANQQRQLLPHGVVLWPVVGTSHHKVYPFTQVVAAWINKQTPMHVIFCGDPGVGKIMQDAIMRCLREDGCDMSRLHDAAGKWSIRQALTFAQIADVVVGPETGILNAVGHEPNAKVIYLSHSSETNLTRDWINTTVLTPDSKDCPCYPCHQLHYTNEFCPQVEETGAALCASSIKPETMYKAIVAAMRKKMKLAV